MESRRPAAAWDSGDAYELYVGRWSRRVAREFLGWLAMPPGIAWLDVGCGTGALSQAILETSLPAEVTGIDRSEDFDDYWTPFLGGQGSAPGYVASLNEKQRAALRERVCSGLPVATDGSISLTARAWAVRGTV